MLHLRPGSPRQPEASAALRVTGFGDFTAFILDAVGKAPYDVAMDVKWVANANEAHLALFNDTADVVFMSYDDTLSVALQEGGPDVGAAWPVHGGILQLCGTVDPTRNLTTVGIDTDTGYARALRLYLKQQLGPSYDAVRFAYVGATNIRFELLQGGSINATLLNPPFTSELPPGGPECVPLYNASSTSLASGPYQGVVANVNRTRLAANGALAERVERLMSAMNSVVSDMLRSPESAISQIQAFYGIDNPTGRKIYASLWVPNGLARDTCFEGPQLSGTEGIFQQDTCANPSTCTLVPKNRTWLSGRLC